MIYAYIRVSTYKQDLQTQKYSILEYANKKDLGKVKFIEETESGRKSWTKRKIKDVVEGLQRGDGLIVFELSRLGRSMLEIMEILSILMRKGVKLHVVKGNLILEDDLKSKILTFAFSIAAEIERELMSERTKEGLKKARAQGKHIGRPKGPGKSKLDPFRPQIEGLLKKGVSVASIAKILGVKYETLYRYIKTRKL